MIVYYKFLALTQSREFGRKSAGGSTEVRDLGADDNNRALLVIVSPRDVSSQARVPTREALKNWFAAVG